MSNKNKQERDPAKDAPEKDDATIKSKSAITPEGKFSPGYETENTQTAKVTNQKKEGQPEKETEQEEEEKEEKEKLTGTPSAKTSTPAPPASSPRSNQKSAKTTAETPSPLEAARQRAQEREREDEIERYEPHPELRYGQRRASYEERQRDEEREYRGSQQWREAREQERYRQLQERQRSFEQEHRQPWESQQERQRQPYVPEHQQRFMQPQQRQDYGQRQYQPEDYMQRQNYPQGYTRQYQEREQRTPQAYTQRYEPQQPRYAQQQPYRGLQGTSYERPHEDLEEFENEQNYGNYRGYGARPYGRRFRSAQAPMSEPERERYFEERYRRQNAAYRYGNDVNFGFAEPEQQYDTPFPRGEYERDYARPRSSEYGRGSGDWSNQGQGYSEYDRSSYWEDDQDWGRRTKSHRPERDSDRNYQPGRISRQYVGDDYVPRYSSDWSRGFEDVYERGLREDPWYNQRRDNDNRDTWQDTDRFAARNARRSRYSEDEENRGRSHFDERTPRNDEDYEFSSSSGRNAQRQESRGRGSRRDEREERSESHRGKSRRNR